MTTRPRILDQLRVFSFLSQESVPTSGAFAVFPVDVPASRDGAATPLAPSHSA